MDRVENTPLKSVKETKKLVGESADVIIDDNVKIAFVKW